MKVGNGQRLLFTGDSITDCGRNRPLGEGNGLGDGYVALVNSLLSVWYPQRLIRIVNTGIGGNRVIDLEARWQTDVLDHKPDWLSIMIGINDVWHQFGTNAVRLDQVDIGRYETTYRRLLEQTRPKLKGLVLMTPYYLETNLVDPIRARMDQYSGVVESLANEFDAVFVNVQAAFDCHLEHRTTQSLCPDRVHVNQSGHLIIAQAYLDAMQFNWRLNKL